MRPTARTLARLRLYGYEADVVERWLPAGRVRRDLFGVIDIVGAGPAGLVGVQCTTASNMAARVSKALAEPRLRAWLLAGARFEVWGWSLRGQRGERKTWQVTVRPVTLADLRRPPPLDPDPDEVFA